MIERDVMRLDLEAALKQGGCPICRLSVQKVEHFLDGLLYESVNDPGVRSHVTAARGFCNRHAWRMRSLGGNALGLALLNRDALKEWQRQLDATLSPAPHVRSERARARVGRATQPRARCLACQNQDETEHLLLQTLLHALADSDFVQILHRSAGLCRPHFAQACALAQGSALPALVASQSESNRRLLAELDEFVRKQDYRFMNEGYGAEGDAWIRAIEHLSGAEGALCST